MIIFQALMEKGICPYCGEWKYLFDLIDTEEDYKDFDSIRTACDRCARGIQ